MTPEFKLHTKSGQPIKTIGKKVIYRTFESQFLHHPFPADELNWGIPKKGDTTTPPQIGRIIEYKVIE